MKRQTTLLIWGIAFFAYMLSIPTRDPLPAALAILPSVSQPWVPATPTLVCGAGDCA